MGLNEFEMDRDESPPTGGVRGATQGGCADDDAAKWDPDLAEMRLVVDRFQRAMAGWGLSAEEVRALLALPSDIVPEVGALAIVAAACPRGERRLRRLLDIDTAVQALLGGEEACRAWLRAPNPGLRGRRPLDLLRWQDHVVGAIRDGLREEARTAFPGWAL